MQIAREQLKGYLCQSVVQSSWWAQLWHCKCVCMRACSHVWVAMHDAYLGMHDLVMCSCGAVGFAGSQGMLVRVFKAAADLMEEGREDTRAYAKRAIWAVAQLAAVTEPGGVERLLKLLPSTCQCHGDSSLNAYAGSPASAAHAAMHVQTRRLWFGDHHHEGPR